MYVDAEFCERSGAQLRFGKASGNSNYPLCGIEDGSTLVLAMIRNHKLYIVNVGDSRAVLCRVTSSGAYTATPLTTGPVPRYPSRPSDPFYVDHKPDLPTERARIEANGGHVTGLLCGRKPPSFALHHWPFNCIVDVPRVDGILSMTRAMGDVTMKPPLTAEPDVVVHALDSRTDKFLILATDGLWDVVTNHKAAKVALSCPCAQAAAAALCKLAMRRNTADNVTVLVVDLARQGNSAPAAVLLPTVVATHVPVGKLSKGQLAKGYAILHTISDTLNAITDMERSATTSAPSTVQAAASTVPSGTRRRSSRAKAATASAVKSQVAKCKAKLKALTSEFYTLIPHNFGMSLPPVIDSVSELKLKLDLLEVMADVELTHKMLETQRTTDANPVDAHYRALGVTLVPIDAMSPEFARIQEYMVITAPVLVSIVRSVDT
ncbi:hypothetical protein DYB32_009904 [Aphanomyces invadans]|uniref:PPM-type phosphatase domain-containing protein n=1 Tax=Aphanomyces invadans TaxID=157072 RepID=A0A418AH80_9STRA|nr:hypothetical protein DYB32_009904 [Aphanomyces invadans]